MVETFTEVEYLNILKTFAKPSGACEIEYDSDYRGYNIKDEEENQWLICSTDDTLEIFECPSNSTGLTKIKTLNPLERALGSLSFSVDIAELLDEQINYLDFKCPVARQREGWRLPTKTELQELYQLSQRFKEAFKIDTYMSSECSAPYRNWVLDFSTGEFQDRAVDESHWGVAWVRLVRDK